MIEGLDADNPYFDFVERVSNLCQNNSTNRGTLFEGIFENPIEKKIINDVKLEINEVIKKTRKLAAKFPGMDIKKMKFPRLYLGGILIRAREDSLESASNF